MDSIKHEPIDYDRETPPPKFSKPGDALSYYTRKSATPFPLSVSRSRNNSGFVVSLELNGTRYEAVHMNPSCAEQILAVYILYGEFGQDSVDLYNYFVKVTKIDSAPLDSLCVNADVEAMKGSANDSSLKIARVAPFSSSQDASSGSGNGFQQGSSTSGSASMPDDSEYSSGSKREWQQQRSTIFGVPEKIRRTENDNNGESSLVFVVKTATSYRFIS